MACKASVFSVFQFTSFQPPKPELTKRLAIVDALF